MTPAMSDDTALRVLPIRQAAFNEKQAAEYFQGAIGNGHAHQLLADLNMLDDILRELGLQDSDECPVEAIRKLRNLGR
jgi:hypothetical protein